MMLNDETKTGPLSGGGHITVTVQGLRDGDEVFFRINRSSGEQTPMELEMEEADEISAVKKRNAETNPPSGCGCITLIVRGRDGNREFFRIKRSEPLKKLVDLYCEQQSVHEDSLIFHFNGRRLRKEQTPDELAMKEGDEIYSLLSQRFC
ncbi:small ubiquitin-related modifier 1-like [Henckelia pumila]|uniref:small ubiquitin-related modifier 1-like n=1 Tax=Henckelia pumila TaxID=405737 RepID=UPI003C6E43C0